LKKPVPLALVAILVATPLLARQHATTGNITLSTTALSFNGSSGNVSSQPLTITSTGQRSVTIQKLSFSNGVFSHSPISLPATLSHGQSLTVKVIAKPQATAQTGKLSITSTANDPTVSLTETAIVKKTTHSVSLTWRAPSSSRDPVDSYQVDRAASGSNQYSTIGTTAASSTAFTDKSVTAGKTYVYEIRSIDQSGRTSNPSNKITLSIP
jgi:hypothetical protein